MFKKKLFAKLNGISLKKSSTMPNKLRSKIISKSLVLPDRKDAVGLTMPPELPSRQFAPRPSIMCKDSLIGTPAILET